MAIQDPLSVEVDSSQYTPQSVLMRRRMAEAMMRQGMDTSPIQSHWQGLARMANALLGGYGAYKLSQEEKGETDALRDFNKGKYTGDSGSTPTPGISSAVESTSRATPASERTNNPGAMYPGPSATKFGSTTHEVIGRNKEHKIAVFPDAESGAAAQFDLLKRVYAGKTLAKAITEWSGGHSSPGYIALVSRATGLSPDTVLTPEMLASPQGIVLAQAMARQEGGRPSPLTPEQWAVAQRRGLGMQAPAAAAAPQELAQAPGTTVAPAAPVAPPAAAVQTPVATPAATPAAPPAAAPPTYGMAPEQMRAEAYRLLGERGALVRQVMERGRPGSPIYKAAEAEFNAALARVQQAQQPIDPAKQAELDYKRSQIRENDAELPGKLAEAKQKQLELDAVLAGQASPAKTAEERAKSNEEARQKALSAVETVTKIGDIYTTLDKPLDTPHTDTGGTRWEKYGDVIGPWSVPSAASAGGGIPGQVVGALTAIPGYALQFARNVSGLTHEGTASANRARNELDTKLTGLQSARVKELFGSQNLSDADREAAAKTVGTMNAQDSKALKGQLSSAEADSFRRIDNALRNGFIKVSDVPREALVRGLRLGLIKPEHVGLKLPQTEAQPQAAPAPQSTGNPLLDAMLRNQAP